MKRRIFLNRKKAFAGRPRKKIVTVFALAFIILIGIFLISFFVSYNRIISEKSISEDTKDLEVVEDEEVAETGILLSEKDEEIEVLKLQIEEYRETIALLQEKERRDVAKIQSLQHELNQLRSRTGHSNVQRDVYGN